MSLANQHLSEAEQQSAGNVSTRPPPPSPHSLANKFLRVVWAIVQATLFRWSPKPMHRWRAMLLKIFGADITMKSRVYPKVKIWAPWNLSMGQYATLSNDVDCYCVKRIRIGDRSTVSQYSFLCGATHDHQHPGLPLIPKEINIGTDVWVAADTFIAPGISIGDGVVIGARSSVFGDLPPWTVCFGSPAKPQGPRIIQSGTQKVNT